MPLTRPDFDHLAVGVNSIAEVVGWASRDLGGAAGQPFLEASWRGTQVAFAGGIRLEALEPIAGPEDDFLVRFLAHSGQGPHHATFKVPDLAARLERLRALGIEPLKVNLESEDWKEAFLHPKLGLGTVVQLAQPSGTWSGEPPRTAAVDGVASAFVGAELRAEPQQAARVLGDVLEADVRETDGATVYSWPGGGSLAVRPVEAGERPRLERFVFRVLDWPPGREALPRQAPLYGGPATILRLGPDEPWFSA